MVPDEGASAEVPRTIVTYASPAFTGTPIHACADFFPALDRLGAHATAAGVRVWVVSSFRPRDRPVAGAIVSPAMPGPDDIPEGAHGEALVTALRGLPLGRRGNHLVGHAVDGNLIVRDTGQFVNSALLRNLSAAPESARAFIRRVRHDATLRWGGDFRTPDVVHFDDGLSLMAPERWARELAELMDGAMSKGEPS